MIKKNNIGFILIIVLCLPFTIVGADTVLKKYTHRFNYNGGYEMTMYVDENENLTSERIDWQNHTYLCYYQNNLLQDVYIQNHDFSISVGFDNPGKSLRGIRIVLGDNYEFVTNFVEGIPVERSEKINDIIYIYGFTGNGESYLTDKKRK